MLPCENSLAGRVPDIHRLLPDSGLSVIGEHFERVEHCLLASRARPSPPSGARTATQWRSGQVLKVIAELA
jgi:prephenate dehydratase